MNKKKIILIISLIVIIGVIVLVIVNSINRSKGITQLNTIDDTTANLVSSSTTKKSTNSLRPDTASKTEETGNATSKVKKETTVTELSDGIKYSVNGGENVVADIVIGDNYFDTQLSDITLNFSKYNGKTIEIEGFYLNNGNFNFVGRYSTANLCKYCPSGYSFFEYEWDGDKELKLTPEKEWLKIIGILRSGNDGTEYYYIETLSLEIMNEKGLDTVNN